MTRANGRPGGTPSDLILADVGGSVAGLTDEQLLGRFVERRDEAAERAFAALVDRHGPMVQGVCRRVLRDPGDAGDAFQATFLVLARRAGSVRMSGSLAPWLYGVSLRVARRARAVAERRNGRERTNTGTPEVADRHHPDAAGPDVRAAIDEELSRLPGRYGSPLILFYLEGLSQEETAGRLGCPVGTVRSRLARGRDLLRDRLSRRGLAPSATPILGALGRPSPVPESILLSSARAAMRPATGPMAAGTVPAGVSSLVAGVSRMMTLQKLAPIAALAIGCVLGALGLAAGQAPQATSAGPKITAAPKSTPSPEAKPSASKPPLVETPGAQAGDDPGAFLDYPAFVVKTEPPTGSTDVDPALGEIRVTFSREMKDGSWSWVTLNKETFPEITGKIAYAKDRRTCVAPVKLEPGKAYAIFLNSPKFVNFRDTEGRPAVPTLLVFKTRK